MGIDSKASYRIAIKINALNSPTRLALMGMLYLGGKKNFKELEKETKLDDNKLAYHLNVLLDVDLIKKKKGYFYLTWEGKSTLKDLGYIERIKNL